MSKKVLLLWVENSKKIWVSERGSAVRMQGMRATICRWYEDRKCEVVTRVHEGKADAHTARREVQMFGADDPETAR